MSMRKIAIPQSCVPLLSDCDVLVCGGGPAGVAAAVAAARHGADVVLLERWPRVGGMATTALVNIWHRSDREKVVINGLVEESLQRAAKNGWVKQCASFPRKHETHRFDPEGMALVWHDMLEESGVRTLCYTVAGEPVLEGNRVRAVVVDTKSGRKAIKAKIVIDATGDGDLAAKSGVPFEYGRTEDGRVQGMTMMYRLCGINEERRRGISEEESRAIREEMRRRSRNGELPPFQPAFNPCNIGNRSIPNMCPVAGNPLDEEELTRLTVRARRQVYQYVAFMRERIPGLEHVLVEQMGFSLGIRESRRIKGLKTLDRQMILSAAKQPDAIGHGIWMIDIHDPLGTGYTTYNDHDDTNMVPRGQSYHIPLRMCLNEQIPNLAVAGRCASSTHEGHSSVRVQTHCMVMGQGVGTVAATALEKDVPLGEVEATALQDTLRADGVYLEDVPVNGSDPEQVGALADNDAFIPPRGDVSC